MKALLKSVIIIFVFSFSFQLLAQSNLDLYRASAPVRVYNNIQLLTKQDKLYTIEDQFAEIAIMIKLYVEPFPDFSFQSTTTSKSVKFSNYRNDIVECFKTLEPTRQVEALASMLYFGEFIEYKSDLDNLINLISEKSKYDYKNALEKVVTIQAAAGFSELAQNQMNAMESSISGAKAEMHLAVTHAINSNFKMAEQYARSSFEKSKNDFYKYERNRTFFQLCRNLGEKKEVELAKELTLLLTDKSDIAVAYGFISKGANDTSLMKEAISLASNLDINNKNYSLKELGVLAAQMKQKNLAVECYDKMSLGNLRQNAVRVLCEIARVYKDTSFLDRAYQIARQIPPKVSIAKSDAEIWIAFTETSINSDENKLATVLVKLTKLEPKYQIKFDMTLIGIPSQRYHYKDSGY